MGILTYPSIFSPEFWGMPHPEHYLFTYELESQRKALWREIKNRGKGKKREVLQEVENKKEKEEQEKMRIRRRRR